MEHFEWHDTLADFVGWLESYGEAHQPLFISKGNPIGFLGPKEKHLDHTVTVGQGEIAGYIRFALLVEEATLLKGTASPRSQMNVVGTRTPGVENPHRKELHSYFTNLMAAIRAASGTGGAESRAKPKAAKTPLPDTPPLPDTVDAAGNVYIWDDVFDWYYRVPRGKCPSVSDLIRLVGKPERTFYRQKELYEKQYGQGHIPNEQSKFG